MPDALFVVGSAGTGSLATLVLRWCYNFATSPGADPSLYQPFTASVVEDLHNAGISFDNPPLLQDLLDKTGLPEKWVWLVVGIAVGFALSPVLDLLFVLKVKWVQFVHGLVRPAPIRRPAFLANA